jgi:hypothetical protein
MIVYCVFEYEEFDMKRLVCIFRHERQAQDYLGYVNSPSATTLDGRPLRYGYEAWDVGM